MSDEQTTDRAAGPSSGAEAAGYASDGAVAGPGGDGRPAVEAVAPPTLPTAVAPQDVPDDAPLDHPSLYFNRELSWLDFNWRVLYQAQDERTPLLERVRFLAITASNLDEFVRKRVGGLKRQAAAGVTVPSPDGRTPETQLRLVQEAIHPMYEAMGTTWNDDLAPSLANAIDLRIRDYADLTDPQRKRLHDYFMDQVFPILTPLAVDPGRPFPFISNMSLSLAVILRHPTRGTEQFARVKVPTSRRRWIELDDEPMHFVPIEQIIAHNIGDLFRGMEVQGVYPFRVTRNANVQRNEEEADDLTKMISEQLRERRFAPVVRLEIGHAMPEATRQLLMRELAIDEADVYIADGLIDYTDVMALADVHVPDDRYERAYRFDAWTPVVPSRLSQNGEPKESANIFEVIRQGDLLVHHPYESFAGSVQRFIEEAARDPKVIAIKQTLYRTSSNSPIVKALVEAAERGKQVAVLVEVKARFDEERNIEWGQKLEDAGVHVAYGLVGLKTHAKVAMVVREEDDGSLRTYCHIGTGNYNSTTARLYTDLGLLTCDREVGYDITNLFHYLTGYAPEQHYRRLVVAPRSMRSRFIELIRQEVDHHQAHGTGRIIAKINALGDPALIRELYRASQAGVPIDLIVRGHCRLRPGLEGYSETIRVYSIVGRFLEHDRIYYFHNDGDPHVLIGSADWQRTKLDDRVETVIPIENPDLRARLVHILERALSDERLLWELRPDGRYEQRRPTPDTADGPAEGLQRMLMDEVRHRARTDEIPWDLDDD